MVSLIKSLSSLRNRQLPIVKESLPAFRKSLLALKKSLSEQNWAVSADLFPLLLLALLWSLGALCYQYLTLPSLPWSIYTSGSTAYLLTLVGFVVFGNRGQSSGASTRIATALAVGAATIFAGYSYGDWSGGSNPAKTNGADSLGSINIFAAILGVVLAAVALIAQKSATDARTEAEQARKDILDALDIKMLALNSHLLEHALTANADSDELMKQAHDTADHDEQFARFLDYGAKGLKTLAKSFMYLHKWTLDPRLTPAYGLSQKAFCLKLDLSLLEKAIKTAGPIEWAEHQRLRTAYWQPASRLIESLLAQGLVKSATPSDAEKVILVLQDVRKMLNQL